MVWRQEGLAGGFGQFPLPLGASVWTSKMGLLEEVVAGTLCSGHEPIREGGDFRSLGREGLFRDAYRAGLRPQKVPTTWVLWLLLCLWKA